MASGERFPKFREMTPSLLSCKIRATITRFRQDARLRGSPHGTSGNSAENKHTSLFRSDWKIFSLDDHAKQAWPPLDLHPHGFSHMTLLQAANQLPLATITDVLVSILVALFLVAVAWNNPSSRRRALHSRTPRRGKGASPSYVQLIGGLLWSLARWIAGRLVPKARTAPSLWCGVGDVLRVADYTINDPLAYWSESRPLELEVSCIDRSLEVGQPKSDVRGRLGTSPKYALISPDQRANYLEWMSTGRVEPLNDVGYAFLFFLGLERRALIDGQDLPLIANEVVRLLKMNKSSGAFDRWLTGFLSYLMAVHGQDAALAEAIVPIFEIDRIDRDDALLSVTLAGFVKRRQPLPALLAHRIAKSVVGSPRMVVLERSLIEFATLFSKRYRDKYGDGLLLRASKRELPIHYEPANVSVMTPPSGKTFYPVRIPNVLALSGQFKPMIELWTESIELLKPLTRARARSGEVLDRVKFEALPDDLRVGLEHPDKPLWDALIARKTAKSGVVLVQIRELAEIQKIEPRKKLTAKQGESLAETAQALRLAIEPDARNTHRLYAWDDLVAVYPTAMSALVMPRDPNYAAASFVLELGVFIAAADGTIDEHEVDHIAHALETEYLLNSEDTQRLEALEKVLIEQPRGLVGLGPKLVAALTAPQREALGTFLVSVAASNGPINTKELVALRSAYKALNLAPAVLDRLVAGRLDTDPQVTASTTEFTPPASLTLDEDLLRQIVSETREVSRRLAEVMDEAEPEDEAEDAGPSSVPAPVSNPDDLRFMGLETRYHGTLAELVTKPEWPRSEFDAIVKRAGLMPSAMLDIVNEWAIDTFGDPILEEQDNRLIVHAELIST